MPDVENNVLLEHYNTLAVRLRGWFGTEAPAQKMFMSVSQICVEFQQLQHRACTKQQRLNSTAVILKKLQDIIDQINNKEIPEVVHEETVLWFEYGGDFYTVFDLCESLIHQYVEYQESIPLLYAEPSPPRRRPHTTSSRESSPQPSSSRGGYRSGHGRDGASHRASNGGHYGGAQSPRERDHARREPKIRLWSLEEIEGMNLVLMDIHQSTKVFQDYVTNMDTIKNSEDLTTDELQFMTCAVKANQEMKKILDDARLSGVGEGGRLSGKGVHMWNPDPLGETDKIRIYTLMQESLQAMATLLMHDEVKDIKTYTYKKRSYDMSTVVNTLLKDAASEIHQLSNRFGTVRGPERKDASMHTLLLRLHSISL